MPIKKPHISGTSGVCYVFCVALTQPFTPKDCDIISLQCIILLGLYAF